MRWLQNSMVARPSVSTTGPVERSWSSRALLQAACQAVPALAGRLVLVMDPRQLYTLDEAVVAKLKDHRPVLIHQLDGFVDAGQAGRLFSANLLENLEHEVLAEFDHDQLHDYRSRRPAMIFDTNQWKSYADLHLRIHRVKDGHGEVFLLFSGPEPDVQWERLAAAVVGLIEQLGVRMTVGVPGQGLSELDRPRRGARQLYGLA
jgi:hypothetical protein